MQRSSSYSVVGKAPVTVPALEIEGAISFVSLPLEGTKEPIQFIPKQQNPIWILVQNLTQFLNG